MDIEYLLALQQWRMTMGADFENALVLLFDTGATAAIALAVLVVYWCYDKEAGFLAASSFILGNFANQLIKSVACVYRPWVLDSRVVPAEAALPGATGYSFPSGHTVSNGAILSSFAYTVCRKWPWLAALCVILALLVGFSRNLLGVHTPQDVLVGFAEAALIVAISVKLTAWLRAHRKRDWLIALIALALGAIALAVVSVKPYPLDYANGQLLMNPASMRKDCFEGVGLLWGFWIGWFCERRWVNFEAKTASKLEKALRIVFGALVAAAVLLALDPLLKASLGLDWAKLVSRFLVLFGATFVVPWAAKLMCRGRGMGSGSVDQTLLVRSQCLETLS